MYRRRLESLRKKLASRVALLRQLARSGWGTGATTLQIATLTLSFCSEPKCLRVPLGWGLMYRRHLESLCKKRASRVALLRRLARSGWGTGATTLQIATLAMVHSIADYCMPVWSRSARTFLIDRAINDALRIVTGCLHQQTTFQSSQASNLLSFVAEEPHCL